MISLLKYNSILIKVSSYVIRVVLLYIRYIPLQEALTCTCFTPANTAYCVLLISGRIIARSYDRLTVCLISSLRSQKRVYFCGVLVTLGLSKDIPCFFLCIKNHQIRHQPQVNWAVSLVIKDCRFNLPLIWICVGIDYMLTISPPWVLE